MTSMMTATMTATMTTTTTTTKATSSVHNVLSYLYYLLYLYIHIQNEVSLLFAISTFRTLSSSFVRLRQKMRGEIEDSCKN